MGTGPIRYGPMTAVLFLVLGFALSSILQSLGSLNMAPNAVESSFLRLYQSFGRLLPFCNGPNVSSLCLSALGQDCPLQDMAGDNKQSRVCLCAGLMALLAGHLLQVSKRTDSLKQEFEQ